MAAASEIRRYGGPSVQSLDLGDIVQEAKHRWLRPTEICEILRNHKKFNIRTVPPVRPAADSLYLFDRKVLRYFRKDGHRWRKKKDGKTVKEAHEKLKAGSVDVLHCYYAHGEENENFQRRSYWMLDVQFENIVLVHYREVKEGYKSGASRMLNADPGSQLGSAQSSSAPCMEQTLSPATTVQASYASSPNAVDWSGQTLSNEYEDGDYGEDPGSSSLVDSMHGGQPTGFLNHDTSSSMWPYIRSSSGSLYSMDDQKFYIEQLSAADFLTHKLIDAKLDSDPTVQDVSLGDGLSPAAQRAVQTQFQNHSDSQMMATSSAKVENTARSGGVSNDEAGELKKLDSFGRWMDKEIGGDCDDSLMASDSGNYWNTLDTGNEDKEVSSLSRHMQLEIDSLGPSLSQEQLFSICDFAPDWAYSGVETKVLITGTFLGDKKHSSGLKWCCMFGEIEVSAEVMIDSVIRCQVPFHAPGCVPFYITCSNRLACSEVREFQFREKPSEISTSMVIKSTPEEEMHFQVRLTKMLLLGLERKWLDCSSTECDKCRLKDMIYSQRSDKKIEWERIEEALMVLEGSRINPRDLLIQNLLKEKLYEWLVCKVHEGDKGPHVLDDEGLGVIHLAAALGYDWAMGPIVAAGVSPNYRDGRGRTALHWASYYGREEAVIALVRLSAAPGAVDDPRAALPGGQTAADLASSRGHKGIAGYLAEADLTTHLFSLTLNDSAMDSAAAAITAEKAIENAEQSVVPAQNEKLSLKRSLVAVRKSARAAALIQSAFRARSFRHRQLAESSSDISEVSLDLVALGSLKKVQKKCHFEDYLHSAAALKIQQKYRGWKGRNEFLKIRNRIVNIQAHVRGHQVRNQYKKFVWAVSIVEKAILRWRRRIPGLRGIQMGSTIQNVGPGNEKNDEYDFLRIGRKQKSAGVEKALARVQSMVRHPEARDQYMRLVTKFENAKISDEETSASQQCESSKDKAKEKGMSAL